MDSGNSGSIQSSSGGDEEYDSRAESISAFLGNHSSGHAGHFTAQPPQNLQTHMLDPISNYLDPMQRSPSLVNLDMVWSKPGTGRSEPNPADLGGLIPCSSSSSALFPTQLATRSASFSTLNHHLLSESASRGLVSVSAATNDQNTNKNNTAAANNNNVVRNPKKRSRASRRAPTTVLTTDTSNFRAMVQEFTGIPAPPFTSSPFHRSRLDLFGSSATIRSPHLDSPPPPPYLLRPFAQKVQSPISNPFVSPPSSSIPSFPTTSSMVGTAAGASNSTNSSTNSTTINYQLSPDLGGLLKQPHPQNFLNMNMHSTPPSLNFQSILKYPLENSSIPQTAYSHLKMGALEEFGLTHANVGAAASGLHNMVSSSTTSGGTLPRIHTVSNPSSNWAEGRGTNNDDDHGVLRSISGTNGKMGFPASSLDFHGDKGPDCVAARSEGMLESWINCSSD
ncbi:hypothetical protein L6164_012375 [Bauhinia variegata]|uniref:Uncharacterized protein n=1 Tax=Bauhinia variegata TaxID=167791 RepID=A0ACB9P9C9_BAUVA|nr:hypothetical protein L6164_012375 [Bauhinia variegata]